MRTIYAVTVAPVVFLWRILAWITADLGRMLTVAAFVAYFFTAFNSSVAQDNRTAGLLIRLVLLIPAIWGAINLYEAALVGVRGYYADPSRPESIRAGAWWPVTNEQWWAYLSWKIFLVYALGYAILGYNALSGDLAWPSKLTINFGYLADLARFTFNHPPTVYLMSIPLPPPHLAAYAAFVVAALLALEGFRRLGAFAWIERREAIRSTSKRGRPTQRKQGQAQREEMSRNPQKEDRGKDKLTVEQPSKGVASKQKRLTSKDVIRELRKELVLPEDTLRAVAELAVLISDPDGFRETWKMDPPKGALLWGPPGTGKTTIAKKIAEITCLHFVNLNPANARSMWIGESAKLIQKAFREARASAPALLFIDEAESIAGNRSQTSGDAAGQEQIAAVNQLLQEIEGVRNETHRYVFILAATNHPDLVDPAFRSRLGREVAIGMPTHENRVEILQNLLYRIKSNVGHVDFEELARRTKGFSGRDLRTLVQLAVTRVHAEGRSKLEWGDLLDAIDEVYKDK